eukprot:scaffold5422_cov36-Tisochrysis_lutea.AAC.1
MYAQCPVQLWRSASRSIPRRTAPSAPRGSPCLALHQRTSADPTQTPAVEHVLAAPARLGAVRAGLEWPYPSSRT